MKTLDKDQALHTVTTVLLVTYGVVPIVAGLDKFLDLLTHWEQYLNPLLAGMLPFSPHVFMMIVGVIEMIAGILVLTMPRFGSLLVMAWLILIALTLIASGHFLDVAVRDLVMSVGAYSISRLVLAREPAAKPHLVS